mgnify:CR=1 FL=1
MENTVIAEGKTTTEAIENGLKQLKVSKNMVDIKVLEEEKKSFFSILAPRVVKVQLTIRENKGNEESKELKRKVNENETEIQEEIEKIKVFLKEFIEKQPVKNINWEVKQNGFDIDIEINGDNEISYLIGYRGEILNALQIVISSIINKDHSEKIRVHIDINGYRQRRVKTLEELAIKVSKTVLRTGKSIALEPMTAYERKIIHSALQGNDKITTFSKGEEPYRKIIIDIKK